MAKSWNANKWLTNYISEILFSELQTLFFDAKTRPLSGTSTFIIDVACIPTLSCLNNEQPASGHVMHLASKNIQALSKYVSSSYERLTTLPFIYHGASL